MGKMKLGITIRKSMCQLFILGFGLMPFSAEAIGNWCTPCPGEQGRCTINSNFSRGGFVANTATVPKKRFGRNAVYIGRHAKVCGKAKIFSPDVKILDQSIVTDDAEVMGPAIITGRSRIDVNAQVKDSDIQDSRISGNVTVSRSSVINSDLTGFLQITNSRLNRQTLSGSGPIVDGLLDQFVPDADVDSVPLEEEQASNAAERVVPLNEVPKRLPLKVKKGVLKKQKEYQQTALLALKVDRENYDKFRKETSEKAEKSKPAHVSEKVEKSKPDHEWEECPTCFEKFHEIKKPIFLAQCGHLFCQECRSAYVKKECPICIAKMTKNLRKIDYFKDNWFPKSEPKSQERQKPQVSPRSEEGLSQ